LNEAIDRIAERHGAGAVRRGGGVATGTKRNPKDGPD
jgi:hypothetical protein